MVIEITGTNFQNKGAELMMLAIIQKMNEEYADKAQCVLRPLGPYRRRAQYGLYQKIQYQQWGVDWTRFIELFPKRLLSQYGLIKESTIQVIFDASGFQYSDQWGVEAIQQPALNITKAKKQGKKIILLPQAFGPFNNPKVRAYMNQIIESVDLVYARDDESYSFLRQISPNAANIRQAPDFTNLVKTQARKPFEGSQSVCILPNKRMLDKTDNAVSQEYIKFLSEAVIFYKNHGLRPFYLVHELNTDREIIDLIYTKTQTDVPVVEEADPLSIKSIIGGSYLVIGSRFHGLISALSQGIPCIGTSWSHKYEMLFREFEISECLVNVASVDYGSLFENSIDKLWYQSKVDQILEKNAIREIEVNKMWSEIFKLLSA